MNMGPMSKKSICIILTTFILIISGCQVWASGKILGVDPNLINQAINGKKLIFQRQYSEALTLFEKIGRDYPESVTGLFGQMAVWQIRMFEYDDFRYRKQYQSLEAKCDKFSLRQLRKGNVPSWELFVHGASDGMRGFFRGREGRWFKSLKHGLHSMRMFKQLKWQEPGFVDVDLGFGMYKYWRSVFTSRLKILPFFGDYRKDGIKLIEKVAQNGEYSRDLAEANLVFIYGNERNFSKELQVLDRILAKYPQNLLMQLMKAKNLLNRKKTNEAMKLFDHIYAVDPNLSYILIYKGRVLFDNKKYAEAKDFFQAYLKNPSGNKYWLAIVNFRLGWIAEIEGDKEEAINYYEKALKYEKHKSIKSRLDKLQRG